MRPGEPGEVLIKGPIVTQGYHRNPEANEKAFTADGWMRTGDVMRIDANNLYHIVDRKKVRQRDVSPKRLSIPHPGANFLL